MNTVRNITSLLVSICRKLNILPEISNHFSSTVATTTTTITTTITTTTTGNSSSSSSTAAADATNDITY